MTAGSVIVAVVCVACFICCCCRCVQKRNLHDTSSDICNHHATPATSVTINNGGPHIPMSHSNSPYQHSTPCAPQHTGYYPMHPVASSQGSHQGVAYSPFRTPNQRESYSHVGSTYSQAPPSYHRSVTPTSSRSGRSHHSHHSNDGSVKYAHCDRVSMPVNL
ncbi:hypothetical protein NP493_283g02022 [Ridgeia piscesae]|uniref:Uncharacterized protein n=1 Tax=Ridgeia piscesae TaxID=27915 RepID=A0AAD9UC55_RIDPI|nr:hypothetical protein NP493_283g02022 [Ridgeia piscesae]